jgi:hypothetical protein
MWWLYPGSVLLIVVAVVARMAWQRRRAPAGHDSPVLSKPVQRFGKLPPADVDALRARAEERRQAAAAKYRASIQNSFDR